MSLSPISRAGAYRWRPASLSEWLASGARVALVASTLLAMVAQATIASKYWPRTPWAFVIVLVGAWTLGRVRPKLAAWVTVASLLVAPALLQLVAGVFKTFHVLWFAGVLGVVLGSVGVSRWNLPQSWRAPVACWALVVAFSWPIVMGRELEWNLDFLYRIAMRVSGNGILARDAVDMILDVTLTHAVGLLWLDWMFSLYASEQHFRRLVIGPLMAGWLLAALVGLYQLTIDMSAFSPGFWVVLKRAVGPLRDANGFGMISAMWGPVFAATLLSRPSRARVGAAAAFAVLSFAGVWGSGSRNAFLMLIAGFGALLLIAVRTPALGRLRWRIAAGTLAGVVAIGIAAFAVDLPVIGPLARIWELVPNRSFAEFLYQFWVRDGYGTVGMEAVQRSPLVGVGIGSFYHIVGDIWMSMGHYRLPPDNAQNWYRHELAELGLLGSLGWIVWVAMVAIGILWPIRCSTDPIVSRVTRAVLILLGIIELVGIPTQVFPVAFSFLTILAWHVCGRNESPLPRRAPASSAIWLVVWGVAIAHAGVTLVAARGEWRVPNRALWAAFPYEYGVYRDLPDLTWTTRHAVLVLPAQSNWLKLVVWTSNPEADKEPVEANVWVAGQQVIRRKLPRNVRFVKYVQLPAQGKPFLLEVKVDRTFRPSDYGSSDSRNLGVAMNWEFVAGPPNQAAAVISRQLLPIYDKPMIY